MTDYRRLTVPALRARCRTAGLPCYQHRGRRLRKADLIDLLTHGLQDAPRGRTPRRTSKTTNVPSTSIETSHTVTQAIIDPYLLDHRVTLAHARALYVSKDELLALDALTMHRILRCVATPSDERHWRTKEVLREHVIAAWMA